MESFGHGKNYKLNVTKCILIEWKLYFTGWLGNVHFCYQFIVYIIII